MPTTRRDLLLTGAGLTGKTVDVLHYGGGPSGGHFHIGAGGGDVYGDLAGRRTMVGNQLWHRSSHWGTRPNPLQAADWPLASLGAMLIGSMSLSLAGRVEDVRNPARQQVPALQVWTNIVSWMPWMKMGQRPG